MTKIIRKTYRRDISFGVMVIIFAGVYFLSDQLFESNFSRLGGFEDLIFGKLLVCAAVLIMVLIVWEEILFHVHIKPVEGGLLFRNHGTKLKFQILLYLVIPLIIAFLFINYEISAFRFYSWAGVCAVVPVFTKLRSGIRNYNDFLLLKEDAIQYRNNQLQDTFELDEVRQIKLVKDEWNVLHKLSIELKSGSSTKIDLDEMELEDFYESINQYLTEHYEHLIRKEDRGDI